MSAREQLAAAVAKAGATAPAASPETFVFRIAMENERTAVMTIPMDTSDTELIQLVAVITGPGRIQLVGQRAKAATTLVRATSMPRPV